MKLLNWLAQHSLTMLLGLFTLLYLVYQSGRWTLFESCQVLPLLVLQLFLMLITYQSLFHTEQLMRGFGGMNHCVDSIILLRNLVMHFSNTEASCQNSKLIVLPQFNLQHQLWTLYVIFTIICFYHALFRCYRSF